MNAAVGFTTLEAFLYFNTAQTQPREVSAMSTPAALNTAAMPSAAAATSFSNASITSLHCLLSSLSSP